MKGQYFSGVEEAREAMTFWQQQLRLQDWEIDLQFRRADEMPTVGSQGACKWTLARRNAIIYLLDPVDYPRSIPARFAQDHEVTLVHELLHLHACPFDRFEEGSPDETALEQMIVATSQALVALYRLGERVATR